MLAMLMVSVSLYVHQEQVDLHIMFLTIQAYHSLSDRAWVVVTAEKMYLNQLLVGLCLFLSTCMLCL